MSPLRKSEEPFDWKLIAPRWMLIGALVISFGGNGFLGAALVTMIIERFQMVEKNQNDPKWDIVARLATVQAEQGVKLKQHDDDLKAVQILNARMLDIQSDIKILNNRLERKGF